MPIWRQRGLGTKRFQLVLSSPYWEFSFHSLFPVRQVLLDQPDLLL